MTNRKKTSLMLFVDYLICLLLQVICIMAFSMLLKYNWANVVYSIFFICINFGMLYTRTHQAAKKDKLLKTQRTHFEGVYMVLPLAICNLILALGYFLIQSNVIPIRDLVVNTVYSFPENEPRVATDILLIDYITPFFRVWFGAFMGFMQGKTTAGLFFLMPLINLIAGGIGYVAGEKKFFLSEHVFAAKEKVKEKFNE